MKNTKQFRIKYYDYEDSELYTIIQVASCKSQARILAEARLRKSTNNFKIDDDIIELNSQHYIEQIRTNLTTSIMERNEPSWLRKRKRTTG